MFTVQEVPFEQAIHLIREMVGEHWNEVPFGNFQLELNLNEEAYQFAESNGYMRTYVVFSAGTAVGYFTLAASDMMHHKGTFQAVGDSYYIHPDYRKSGAFVTLLLTVEEALAKQGIRFLTIGVNPTFDRAPETEVFLHSKGYQLTEKSYTKEL